MKVINAILVTITVLLIISCTPKKDKYGNVWKQYNLKNERAFYFERNDSVQYIVYYEHKGQNGFYNLDMMEIHGFECMEISRSIMNTIMKNKHLKTQVPPQDGMLNQLDIILGLMGDRKDSLTYIYAYDSYFSDLTIDISKDINIDDYTYRDSEGHEMCSNKKFFDDVITLTKRSTFCNQLDSVLRKHDLTIKDIKVESLFEDVHPDCIKQDQFISLYDRMSRRKLPECIQIIPIRIELKSR